MIPFFHATVNEILRNINTKNLFSDTKILFEEKKMIDNSFKNPKKSFKKSATTDLIYMSPFEHKMGDVLFVESLGITLPTPNYRIERYRTGTKRFGIYIFEYVYSGKGYIECEGIKYSVGAGDFYFLNNNTSHIYYSDPDEPYRKIWINVRGTLIAKLLEAYSVTAPVVVLPLDVKALLEEICEIFKEDCELDSKLERTSLCLHKIIAMMDKALRKEDVSIDLPQRLKMYIDNRESFSLTVEQLAEKFHLNSNYTTSVFKRKYGTTPKQYMLERKMTHAKQLLANKNCEIKEIAATLSFSSVYHFSNTFKRLTGQTPSEFRRSTMQA